MQITGDPKIASAFVKARTEIGGTVGKDAKGNFGKYATLAAITEATSEIMGSHGLAIVQECFADEAGVTVYTTVVHESGATMEFAPLSLPVERKNAQGVGSAITYARRYQLSAICGLAPDDDDGTAAAANPGSGRAASSGSINSGPGPCKVCRAPAGKIHASSCTATEESPTPPQPHTNGNGNGKHEPDPTFNSLNDVEELDPTPTEEFDAIPSVPKGQPSSDGASGGISPNTLRKLQAQFTNTFGGLDVDAARHWYIEKWTTKHTPDDIRSSASTVTDDEAEAMIPELKKYTKGLRSTFEAQSKATSPIDENGNRYTVKDGVRNYTGKDAIRAIETDLADIESKHHG